MSGTSIIAKISMSLSLSSILALWLWASARIITYLFPLLLTQV